MSDAEKIAALEPKVAEHDGKLSSLTAANTMQANLLADHTAAILSHGKRLDAMDKALTEMSAPSAASKVGARLLGVLKASWTYILVAVLAVGLSLGVTGFKGCDHPTPTPTPVPPPPPHPPEPPAPPAPIPGEGIRALIIFETAEAAKLTSEQQMVIYGQVMRDYFDSVCAQGPKNKDWRIFDKDVDASKDSQIWQDALKRPRTSLPWLIVSNGKTGFEGPLPSVEKVKEIIEKLKRN